MASTCVAVMLSSRGHPAAWCTSTVYSAASCFELQTTYVSAWKQVQKKKRSDSKPLFHAPLVHQGNNRLIQRLRSGPLESESCSHGGFGMAGVRQSLSGCVVLGTLHTLWQAQTNSGTQSRPWHQTPLCQNRAVFRRRRAQNPNNQHAFFFFPTLWSAVEKTIEPISEASRRRVLLQFVMLDGNPSKQTRWELSLKWGEAT